MRKYQPFRTLVYKIIGFEIDGILTRFIPGPGDADIAGCVESQLLANRLDQRSPRDAILNYRCFTSVRSWPKVATGEEFASVRY